MLNQMVASMEASYKWTVKRTLLRNLWENCDMNDFERMEAEEQKEHLEKCFESAIVKFRSILK